MRRRSWVRLASLVSLLPPAAAVAPAAAECGHHRPPQPIRFARGASSARVEGGVPRGGRDCRTLRAQAGQTLEVRLDSVERNAVFQIYAPGWRIAAPGGEIQGAALPGAGETDDATRWSGRLPAGGEVLIVIGSTRGGAEYQLEVSAR